MITGTAGHHQSVSVAAGDVKKWAFVTLHNDDRQRRWRLMVGVELSPEEFSNC